MGGLCDRPDAAACDYRVTYRSSQMVRTGAAKTKQCCEHMISATTTRELSTGLDESAGKTHIAWTNDYNRRCRRFRSCGRSARTCDAAGAERDGGIVDARSPLPGDCTEPVKPCWNNKGTTDGERPERSERHPLDEGTARGLPLVTLEHEIDELAALLLTQVRGPASFLLGIPLGLVTSEDEAIPMLVECLHEAGLQRVVVSSNSSVRRDANETRASRQAGGSPRKPSRLW
jgi:hypothetical protein